MVDLFLPTALPISAKLHPLFNMPSILIRSFIVKCGLLIPFSPFEATVRALGFHCNACCNFSVEKNATSPWTAYRCICFFNWHSLTEALTKLETNMSYLQDTVRQLNDIVTEQQLLVSRLERQNEVLAKRVEELDTEARPNRRPPHY